MDVPAALRRVRPQSLSRRVRVPRRGGDYRLLFANSPLQHYLVDHHGSGSVLER